MASQGTQQQRQRKSAARLANLTARHTLSRSMLANHYYRQVSTLSAKSQFPNLSAFLPQNLWPWISDYLKNALTKRYPFPAYPQGKTGVYQLAPGPSGKFTFAVAGDWATGTLESQTVADLMCNNKPDSEKPDFTIHLGDVYYVGDTAEIDENCNGDSTGQFQGVKWPHGRQGSFALNGNHEMYANGKPYFTGFLLSLGMNGDPAGQIASFFSLETPQWRILAIDTGYNSVGIPILSQIPVINSIPAVGGDCHLRKELLDWLRNTVKPQTNRKATLLLSHHQYFTAFSDHAYTKPAKQLMEFFKDQEIVWMWGHEHRLGIYDKFADGGITAYGRCLGHGGMPVETGGPVSSKKAPLRYYDERTHALPDDPNVSVGQNGFANISIEQATLTLEYRDIGNSRLLTETFTPDASGKLQYTVDDSPGILKKL